MISFRIIATSVSFAALIASLGGAQDLAKYHDFQFGMSLESVAKQIHMNASSAQITHQRPALIQTLQWLNYSDTSAKDKSIRSIRFDFYNDQLSKMIVTYDPAGTEGLTTDDMIEAISAIYGPQPLIRKRPSRFPHFHNTRTTRRSLPAGRMPSTPTIFFALPTEIHSD
jgi:hypothetical protein